MGEAEEIKNSYKAILCKMAALKATVGKIGDFLETNF